MHQVRHQLNKTFTFERLESRTVLNGTVTVSIPSPGLLDIEGDRGNNAISVHQVGTNKSDGGAIIQVVGLGTKILNAQTGKTGTSFKFGTDTGVVIVGINLGAGSDNLNLYSTTLSDGISINMGDGNDVVIASNVHCGLLSVSLGDGNNVANVYKVTALAGGFGVVANNGNNAVTLNKVSTGENLLEVELGSGFNSVAVVNCVADSGFFSDNGADGVLSGVGNSFAQQTVDTFEFRFGDLANDEA